MECRWVNGGMAEREERVADTKREGRCRDGAREEMAWRGETLQGVEMVREGEY